MPLPEALACCRPGREVAASIAPIEAAVGSRLAAGRSPLRRALASLSLSLLAAGALGCRAAPPPRQPLSAAPRQAELNRQQQQQALRQCQQRRDDLLAGLAELRRAEAALADQRSMVPPPLSAPPVWDEEKEQRYSEVDQELDRQRYEQELAVWRQRQAERQAVVAEQRQRLAEAQQRLDRQAQLLQQRYPGLFTAPTSIEVKPQELERLSRCPAAGAA